MTEQNMTLKDFVADAQQRVGETTVAAVSKELTADPDAFVLIDVREESEYAAGHIKGAMQLGRGILERDIEKRLPNKETPIVCYCGGGSRSLLAGDTLQKMGYKNVLSMTGGMRAWREANQPEVK